MIYIDVHPLLEPHYTGVPHVVANLAAFWLRRPEKARFFLGQSEIDASVVESILERRTGRYFHELRSRSYGNLAVINANTAARSVGFFPHARKTTERMFGREVRLVHDLTGVLTPELQPPELAAREAEKLKQDITSADRIVCVSHATADDVSTYFRLDRKAITVAHLGVDWPETAPSVYLHLRSSLFEPYILILGTFEPRKNISMVLRLLEAYPALTERFTVCVCGGAGWGHVSQELERNEVARRLVDAKRLRIIPFVSEKLKYALIKEASFLLCPSFIEGFGLPVLEALSLGVPVVTSIGGSLPEVAGNVGYYFDPYDLPGLINAIIRLLQDLDRDAAAVRGAALNRALQFRWDEFNSIISNVIAELEYDLDRER